MHLDVRDNVGFECDDMLLKLGSHTSVKWLGCASSVGLLPAALGPSFLDKGVGTGLATIQVGPACAQTRPGLPGAYLRQAELFQASCGKHT